MGSDAGQREDATSIFLEGVRQIGVIPVVTIEDAASAPALVLTLLASGLTHIEITLRTPAALDALTAASGSGAVLGAGTVTTAAEATRAISAGAQFVVSPGLDEGVVRRCQGAGVPVLPGVATPTEVMTARSWGLRAVKVFPVASMGGVGFVRSLSAVWPDLDLVPTGGVTLADASDYLAVPAVAAVAGSWMVPTELVRGADWEQLGARARAASTLRWSVA